MIIVLTKGVKNRNKPKKIDSKIVIVQIDANHLGNCIFLIFILVSRFISGFPIKETTAATKIYITTELKYQAVRLAITIIADIIMYRESLFIMFNF